MLFEEDAHGMGNNEIEQATISIAISLKRIADALERPIVTGTAITGVDDDIVERIRNMWSLE